MTVREFAKKLEEAKIKYNYPKTYDSSSDLNDAIDLDLVTNAMGYGPEDGVMLYSPQLQKLRPYKDGGVFLDAASAAHDLKQDADFVNQGNRLEAEDRSERSIAQNIFYAAWGTENRSDKDDKGGQRNSAYAYKDNKGNKVNLFWDFVDVNDLPPDLKRKYNNVTTRLNSEEITKLKKSVPEQVNQSLTISSPEVAAALQVTQDEQNWTAFKDCLEEWAKSFEDPYSPVRDTVKEINVFVFTKFKKPIYCLSSVDKAQYAVKKKGDNGLRNTESSFKDWLFKKEEDTKHFSKAMKTRLDQTQNPNEKEKLSTHYLKLQLKIENYKKVSEYLKAVQLLREKGYISTLDKRSLKHFSLPI